METAQFKWTIFDDIIIGIASPGQVVDADWAKFLNELKTRPITKYLQYTPGSTQLSSVQRKLGIDAVQERKLDKVIMVTDSAVVRGIVTAASWFGVNVASWRVSQLPEALAALGLPPNKQATLLTTIQELSKGMT